MKHVAGDEVVASLGSVDSVLTASAPVRILNQTWALEVAASSVYVEDHQSALPSVVLVTGLLLATLLGITMFTALVARANSDVNEQFAFVASHDLQEPLRMVASYTQLLERRYGDKLDDRARDFIGFASAGAVRMQSMVKDLLNYSRVGRLGSERELVDLKRVMERACANLMLQIDSNDAVIKIDGALPTIYGYRTMMLQLFQNMIENAIKFRVPDKQPVVRISVATKARYLRITFADNGIGIAQQHRERVFLPFKRLHDKKSIDGNGIGLALCLKIARMHGGWIELDSVEGEGSCSDVFLAASSAAVQPPRQTGAA